MEIWGTPTSLCKLKDLVDFQKVPYCLFFWVGSCCPVVIGNNLQEEKRLMLVLQLPAPAQSCIFWAPPGELYFASQDQFRRGQSPPHLRQAGLVVEQARPRVVERPSAESCWSLISSVTLTLSVSAFSSVNWGQ